MTIAVIILNYNSSADCRKCIGFLKRQEGVEAEIVVVDNCSPHQGEQEIIKQLCAEQDCTFIQANENRGYNAGNNIGLRYAAEKGYKYALIANPDMEFTQTDYLRLMARAMEQDEDIVACGSDIVTLEGIHQNPMKRDGSWYSSFGWIKGLLRRKKVANTYEFIDNYRDSHYCSKLSGCCLMIRINFVKDIGFFDEHVFLYCEEAIISRQVERNGKRMYYLADIRAIHNHIKVKKGNPVKRFEHWRASRIYYINRYANYPWYGRWLSSFSMRLYVAFMMLYYKTRH